MYIIRALLMNITFSVYVCAYDIFLPYKQYCIILFILHPCAQQTFTEMQLCARQYALK